MHAIRGILSQILVGPVASPDQKAPVGIYALSDRVVTVEGGACHILSAMGKAFTVRQKSCSGRLVQWLPLRNQPVYTVDSLMREDLL